MLASALSSAGSGVINLATGTPRGSGDRAKSDCNVTQRPKGQKGDIIAVTGRLANEADDRHAEQQTNPRSEIGVIASRFRPWCAPQTPLSD